MNSIDELLAEVDKTLTDQELKEQIAAEVAARVSEVDPEIQARIDAARTETARREAEEAAEAKEDNYSDICDLPTYHPRRSAFFLKEAEREEAARIAAERAPKGGCRPTQGQDSQAPPSWTR